MSNTQITYFVAASAGVFGLAAYFGLVLVPAWGSYTKLWERLAAAFLTLYVLVAFLAIGFVGGVAFIWFYDTLL